VITAVRYELETVHKTGKHDGIGVFLYNTNYQLPLPPRRGGKFEFALIGLADDLWSNDDLVRRSMLVA